MKKTILLSAMSVFSLMIAGKTFAQSHGHDIKQYAHRESKVDFRVISQDKAAVNYDLNLISEKKDELRKDKAFHKLMAYRQDKRQLTALKQKLAFDQAKLDRDMKFVHNDGRVADRF